MKEEEVILEGGRSAESVVRIGQVVHRTKGNSFEFCHKLLKHLENNGFTFSPRFLGIDDKGREKLSFIEGDIPLGVDFTDQQLIKTTHILREFHNINSRSPLCGSFETICHNDFAPWNIVFNEDMPVGLIDYDEAAPGLRINDFAYFIWTFLDLGLSQKNDADQINRMVLLSNEYDLSARFQLIDALLIEQNRILEFRRGVVLNEKDESKRDFSKGAIERIIMAMQWVNSNRKKIEAALQA